MRSAATVAAAAAVAWLAVALGALEREPPSDVRRLVPGVAAADVAAIEVARGDQAASARRGPSGFVTGQGGPADAAVVDLLLGAVEHTWVRRLRRGAGQSAELGLDRPRATTSVTSDGGAVRLALGVALEGRELVWVGVGGDAALITTAESAQLFPAPERLRDRRLLSLAAVDRLVVAAKDATVRASGDPEMTVEIAGGRARIDVAELEALLESLRAAELVAGAPGAPVEPLRVELAGPDGARAVEVVAACAGDPRSLAVKTSAGQGCVAAAALEPARALVAEPGRLVEDRLLDPRRRARSAVMRRGGDEISIDPAGSGREAALAWLAALDRAVSGLPAPLGDPRPATAATIEIRYAGGVTDTLTIHAGEPVTARRNDEPVALPIAGAAELLAAEPVWFRERALIERDPTELVSATSTVAGGRVALDVAAIAPVVAHLSAERFVAAEATAAHGLARPRAVIELRFSPPPIATGDPDRVTLEIGAPVAGATSVGGCYARLSPGDGAVFVASAQVCAALAP